MALDQLRRRIDGRALSENLDRCESGEHDEGGEGEVHDAVPCEESEERKPKRGSGKKESSVENICEDGAETEEVTHRSVDASCVIPHPLDRAIAALFAREALQTKMRSP